MTNVINVRDGISIKPTEFADKIDIVPVASISGNKPFSSPF